ncbi:uncharacterized protein LOC129726124 [Wyeomyia smithii]|uniref:uncharacterized protein LOC129726124 n=1 Tax=Wyeomyia smithii TaxID=174621 RepID=UPI002467DD13|nr:uncharacterized protein LOC129726124 [Wyeomyia smithii]
MRLERFTILMNTSWIRTHATQVYNALGDGYLGASFAVPAQDCPEHIPDHSENCVLQYKLDQCCSTGHVCGDDRNKLIRCNLAGSSYYEEEEIEIPGDPCRYCICAAGFDKNHLSNYENCLEVTCQFELYGKLDRGAIPVYLDGSCCSEEWRLPNSADKLVKSAVAVDNPTLQCKYGDITMNVGDSLEPITTSVETYQWRCAIHPPAHCKIAKTGSY